MKYCALKSNSIYVQWPSQKYFCFKRFLSNIDFKTSFMFQCVPMCVLELVLCLNQKFTKFNLTLKRIFSVQFFNSFFLKVLHIDFYRNQSIVNIKTSSRFYPYISNIFGAEIKRLSYTMHETNRYNHFIYHSNLVHDQKERNTTSRHLDDLAINLTKIYIHDHWLKKLYIGIKFVGSLFGIMKNFTWDQYFYIGSQKFTSGINFIRNDPSRDHPPPPPPPPRSQFKLAILLTPFMLVDYFSLIRLTTIKLILILKELDRNNVCRT